jgi:hypothetical protein
MTREKNKKRLDTIAAQRNYTLYFSRDLAANLVMMLPIIIMSIIFPRVRSLFPKM